jgi:hypothetical protein
MASPIQQQDTYLYSPEFQPDNCDVVEDCQEPDYSGVEQKRNLSAEFEMSDK